jgi:uncharacterized protein involved in exopolysaccharide biosynthesis
MEEPNKIIQEDEIDLLELARFIWGKRRFIIKVTSIFVALGLFIAFTRPVGYEASCKLMPESQEGVNSSLGGLGGLAGLAGINLDMGTSGSLTPQLYPEIVKSIPFQLKLIHEPVYFQNLDSSVSSYYYLSEVQKSTLVGFILKYTIRLPGTIIKMLKKDEIIVDHLNNGLYRFTEQEWSILESYRERFNVEVDSKTRVITVTTEMPDPFAAAIITNMLVKHLTEEVTRYKIEKVKLNLDFVQERYEEAEKRYQQKQRALALFADQNKNIISSTAQIESQRLQNELNIAFELVKGLASKLEQAKIKVKEETPVFTVLEPVQIPIKKSKPNKKLILLVAVSLGICFSVFYILLKKWLSYNTGND